MPRVSHTTLCLVLLCACGHVFGAFTNREDLPRRAVNSTCGPTAEEQTIQEYVKIRRDRYPDEIREEIRKKTYTIDSLNQDVFGWWVVQQLAGQRSALASFTLVMEEAKADFVPASALGDVLVDWLEKVISTIAGKVVPELTVAAGFIQQGLEEYVASALDNEKITFYQAALQYEQVLPDKTAKSLLMVDNFINCVRNKPGLLLPAYDFVTELIAAMPSMRDSFNAYYARFLVDAMPDHDHFFLRTFQASNVHAQRTVWPMSPKGLNPCDIADYAYHLNVECVHPSMPAVQLLGLKVAIQGQITPRPKYPYPPPPKAEYALIYSCGKFSTPWAAVVNYDSGPDGGLLPGREWHVLRDPRAVIAGFEADYGSVLAQLQALSEEFCSQGFANGTHIAAAGDLAPGKYDYLGPIDGYFKPSVC